MHKLKAVIRLTAVLVEGTDEIDAQFDSNREAELRKVQGHMRGQGLIFSFSRHHLYHKSNDGAIAQEAETAANILNELGYEMRIVRGIFARPSFALKGREGIVLQKVQGALRIFFSI